MSWNGRKFGFMIEIIQLSIAYFCFLRKELAMSFFKIFSFFAIISVIACNGRSDLRQNSSEDLSKEEVLDFLKIYDDAWNGRKNNVVDSLYAPGYRYFTSVGGVSSRARNLEILAADYYKLISANRTEIDITIDGNTAIVSSRWQGDGLWKGQPFKDNQRCGLVIQKKQRELKLLSEHCVDITTGPAFD